MKVIITQPCYMPWLPYFARMKEADMFISLDNVRIPSDDVIHRNKIRMVNDDRWLTVPITGEKIINKVQIDNTKPWRREHWKAIQRSYGRCEHYDDFKESFKYLYSKEWHNLVDLNDHTIKMLMAIFNIDTPFQRASTLPHEGTNSKLILSLCQAVGADTYLSGPMGKLYLAEQDFKDAGIEVKYVKDELIPYKQRWPGFVPNMSAIDYLFNCGAEISGGVKCSY